MRLLLFYNNFCVLSTGCDCTDSGQVTAILTDLTEFPLESFKAERPFHINWFVATNLVLDTSEFFSFNVASFICDVRCIIDSNMKYSILMCDLETACGDPEIGSLNAVLAGGGKVLHFTGKVVTYSCEANKVAVSGANSRTCLVTGVWSNSALQCEQGIIM